jgi:hypothetical protein
MTTRADFTLNDTPQSNGVYRATAGGTVELKLVDGLLIDAAVVKVSLERKTKNATDIPELATPYVLSPATATLELTIPNEISSWLIRVQLNEGSSAKGVEPTWTRERIIETVGTTGVAKQLAGEQTQRHPERGWSDIQNDEVDALETLAAGGGGGGPDPFDGLDVESEHRADEGVEAGYFVQRWVDQRGYRHFVPFERDLTLWYVAGPDVEAAITTAAADAVRLPLRIERDFGDGFAALSRPGFGVGGLWSRTPLVFDLSAFTIAIRICMASGNGQTILSLTGQIPRVDLDDVPKLTISWSYTSGGSGDITARLVDAAVAEATASKTITHSAWHTVIVRYDGSNLSVRSDGVNGAAESFPTPDDLHVEHTSLACDLFPDGTANGQIFSGTAIRHILAAPRAWSDAECLTAEAALTDIWT